MAIHFHDIPEVALASDSVTARVSVRNCTGLYESFGKRLLDVTLVLLAAPVILIIVSLLAVFVALDGGRPFYSQKRVGKGGRIYRMWKLRTMVVNADACLEAYLAANPQARAEWNKTQKLKSDPRITAFGQFLRRSSLDELPQLWNVLAGHMSLVGPRPMMVSQKDLYPGTDYYDLRPGLTGLWQVSARNDTTFADRADFDSRYRQELSFSKDLQLICATFRVVLKATGH